MKKIIQSTMRKAILASALLVFLLISGCSDNETNSIVKKEIVANSKKDITGFSKDAYTSIIFGDGAFTESIPVLKNNFNKEKLLTAEQLQQYREVEKIVVHYIDKHHPEFWSTFYSDISSKQPLRVSQGIENAVAITKEAIQGTLNVDIEKQVSRIKEDTEKSAKILGSLKKGDKDDLQKLLESAEDFQSSSDAEYSMAIAVVAVAFLAAGVYIWLIYARWETVTYPSAEAVYSSSGSLQDNELVAQVTNYF